MDKENVSNIPSKFTSHNPLGRKSLEKNPWKNIFGKIPKIENVFIWENPKLRDFFRKNPKLIVF